MLSIFEKKEREEEKKERKEKNQTEKTGDEKLGSSIVSSFDYEKHTRMFSQANISRERESLINNSWRSL